MELLAFGTVSSRAWRRLLPWIISFRARVESHYGVPQSLGAIWLWLSRLSQRALGARPPASGPAILFFPSLPPEGSTPHCTHCPIALSASRPCRPLLHPSRSQYCHMTQMRPGGREGSRLWVPKSQTRGLSTPVRFGTVSKLGLPSGVSTPCLRADCGPSRQVSTPA